MISWGSSVIESFKNTSFRSSCRICAVPAEYGKLMVDTEICFTVSFGFVIMQNFHSTHRGTFPNQFNDHSKWLRDVLTRDAKISAKAKPEPRPAPHKICGAQHGARPASLKHRTKPGRQCITHCDGLPRARHEPDALNPGSAKSPAGFKFWARPGRRAWTLHL